MTTQVADARKRMEGNAMKTVYMVTPITDKAKEWVAANVPLEPWQWSGGIAFAVEHRYIADLVNGMVEDGLVRGKDFEVN